jgi:hypothetical protein
LLGISTSAIVSVPIGGRECLVKEPFSGGAAFLDLALMLDRDRRGGSAAKLLGETRA